MRGNSKFVDRRYLSLRENIRAGEIIVVYIETERQIADALTKATYGIRHETFSKRMMGMQ